jgi:hypothetical protein
MGKEPPSFDDQFPGRSAQIEGLKAVLRRNAHIGCNIRLEYFLPPIQELQQCRGRGRGNPAELIPQAAEKRFNQLQDGPRSAWLSKIEFRIGPY